MYNMHMALIIDLLSCPQPVWSLQHTEVVIIACVTSLLNNLHLVVPDFT